MALTQVEVDIILNTAESAKSLGELRTATKQVKAALDDVEVGSESFVKLNAQLEEGSEKLQKFRRGFDDIKIYESFGKTITSSFGLASSAIGLFTNDNDKLQKSLLKVQSALVLVQSFGQLAEAVKLAKVANDALNSSLLTNPYVLVAVGIAAAVVALISFNDAADESIKKLDEYNQKLDELIDKFRDESFGSALGKVQKDFENIANTVAPTAATLRDAEIAFEAVKQKVSDGVFSDQVIKQAQNYRQSLVDLGSELGKLDFSNFDNLDNEEKLGDLDKSIAKVGITIDTELKGRLQRALVGDKDSGAGIDKFIETLDKEVQKAGLGIKQSLDFQDILDKDRKKIDELKKGLEQVGFNTIFDQFQSSLTRLNNSLVNNQNLLKTIGADQVTLDNQEISDKTKILTLLDKEISTLRARGLANQDEIKKVRDQETLRKKTLDDINTLIVKQIADTIKLQVLQKDSTDRLSIFKNQFGDINELLITNQSLLQSLFFQSGSSTTLTTLDSIVDKSLELDNIIKSIPSDLNNSLGKSTPIIADSAAQLSNTFGAIPEEIDLAQESLNELTNSLIENQKKILALNNDGVDNSKQKDQLQFLEQEGNNIKIQIDKIKKALQDLNDVQDPKKIEASFQAVAVNITNILDTQLQANEKLFQSGKIGFDTFKQNQDKIIAEAKAGVKNLESAFNGLITNSQIVDKLKLTPEQIKLLQDQFKNLFNGVGAAIESSVGANRQKILDSISKYTSAIAGSFNNAFSAIGDSFRQASDARIAVIEQEGDATQTLLEQQYNKQQDALQANLDRGLVSQKSYSDSQKRLQDKYNRDKERAERESKSRANEENLKAFRIQKGISIAQAVASTAAAVANALAVPPFPLGVGLAIGAGITGAIQIATIESQPEPKFAKGGLFKGVGGPTDDSNKIRISDGEYIINAQSTAGFMPLLDAINKTGNQTLNPVIGQSNRSNSIDSVSKNRVPEQLSSNKPQEIKVNLVFDDFLKAQSTNNDTYAKTTFG